uniref:Uncharacterized protein n=1 Tax=Lotharella oceanica TaxID=641309 RepID=A0A7S2XAV9_9EUKA|mmetsp:Transcript_25849/g.48234  ORF Transcript_25849/g.48234 Transcript_25849/m.48234 type:complete len:107 (+) Transcript_25849:122-442(+)
MYGLLATVSHRTVLPHYQLLEELISIPSLDISRDSRATDTLPSSMVARPSRRLYRAQTDDLFGRIFENLIRKILFPTSDKKGHSLADTSVDLCTCAQHDLSHRILD